MKFEITLMVSVQQASTLFYVPNYNRDPTDRYEGGKLIIGEPIGLGRRGQSGSRTESRPLAAFSASPTSLDLDRNVFINS